LPGGGSNGKVGERADSGGSGRPAGSPPAGVVVEAADLRVRVSGFGAGAGPRCIKGIQLNTHYF
jgi:hypothetical protein